MSAVKAVPGRRKELCKYFALGYCRNSQRCPFVHEYPAQKFTTDERQSRYSHDTPKESTDRLIVGSLSFLLRWRRSAIQR
ncbi:zf-CCCH domain containing protein [Trichuris trichiura]|uniref:Zf-CCCH domain containing protein n=1 Tax=Trichuris trichiura TaxID=36087 RepID=A0A077YWY2_TRITR|nr:zf-CCCH domain containing protein [Trichuris trichiura]